MCVCVCIVSDKVYSREDYLLWHVVCVRFPIKRLQRTKGNGGIMENLSFWDLKTTTSSWIQVINST